MIKSKARRLTGKMINIELSNAPSKVGKFEEQVSDTTIF